MLKSSTDRLQASGVGLPVAQTAKNLVSRSAGTSDLANERVMVRLAFSRLELGGQRDWTFVCDGRQAEDIAEAVLQRRPVRLAFPDNIVIVDGAEIGVADFQPLPGVDKA